METGGAFASITQRIDRVDPRGVPCGKKSEEDSSQQCGHTGGQQHCRVECDLIAARNPVARQTREKHIQTPTGEQNTGDPAGGNKQKRFDQMSARDGSATRAQSETNRNFALPGRGADELQTGDIGAGDEKHDESGETNLSIHDSRSMGFRRGTRELRQSTIIEEIDS